MNHGAHGGHGDWVGSRAWLITLGLFLAALIVVAIAGTYLLIHSVLSVLSVPSVVQPAVS